MKQRTKQALAVLLCVLLLVGAMPALTAAAETLSGSCGDGVTWELDTQTGVFALDGTGQMADYPNEWETPWVFHTQEIRELVVGEGITRLGNYAFAACPCLENVTFVSSTDEDSQLENGMIDGPGVIDMDDLCGVGASVTVEEIPEPTLTGSSDAGDPDTDCDLVIGDYAFQACSALQDVTIPGRVTHIGRQAFADCSALRRIVIKEQASLTVTPGGIGPEEPELGSGVTVSLIPEADLTGSSDECGGRSIDNFAFCNNEALRYIHIPADVTDIGDGILAGEGHCYICSDTENCAAKTYADREFIEFRLCTGHVDFVDLFGACGKDGDHLTWELDDITGTLTISGTGEMADYDEHYYNETKAPWVNWKVPVRTVVIEDGVTRIGTNAFYDCTDLTSVTIPDSVTRIGEDAFEFCTSLASVTIPQGVTQIESCAFAHCFALADVTIPDAVTQIDQFAFFDCRSFQHVTIPDGVTSIGQYAFAECETLESVTIPESVTSLGDYAFYNCESLQRVTMPDALRNTGYRVFYGCPKTLQFYSNHEHSFGDPEWVWAQDYSAATATFACAVCGDAQTVTDTSPLMNELCAAGCMTEGVVTYTAHAEFRGETYADTTDEIVTGPASGHDYDRVVSEPTTTVGGYTTYTCRNCGDSYIDDYTDPLPQDAVFAVVSDARVERIAGNTVDVTVEVTDNPGFISAILCIDYDPQQLQLIRVENGSVFDNGAFTESGDLAMIPFTVLYADGNTREDVTATGDLLTLTFAVQPTATAGTTTVTVTCRTDSAYDVNFRPVAVQTSDGTVELFDRLPGDVDGDGKVTTKDAVILARYLAGGWDVQINQDNAVVNGDGKIDVLDLILIRRYLAGGWNVVLV